MKKRTDEAAKPLVFEEVVTDRAMGSRFARARCPGGWVVANLTLGGVAFVPDLDGAWLLAARVGVT